MKFCHGKCARCAGKNVNEKTHVLCSVSGQRLKTSNGDELLHNSTPKCLHVSTRSFYSEMKNRTLKEILLYDICERIKTFLQYNFSARQAKD